LGEEKPEEELWGNVSLLRGCRRHFRVAIYIIAGNGMIYTLIPHFSLYSGDKMRVISGQHKGRILQAVPGNTTRPTTDKVKESLFSMIGPYFQGGVCLDLYAGTGSLGIEAISRGMERGIFVDIDRKAIETIRHNIRSLGIEQQTEVYKNDALRALNALMKRKCSFDLVFLDPPYAKENNALILHRLSEGGLLKPGAIISVEHDASRRIAEIPQGMEIWKENRFGDISLTIFTYHS
jgi:16S rRNA (guanine966-N2)-methyltransferase